MRCSTRKADARRQRRLTRLRRASRWHLARRSQRSIPEGLPGPVVQQSAVGGHALVEAGHNVLCAPPSSKELPVAKRAPSANLRPPRRSGLRASRARARPSRPRHPPTPVDSRSIGLLPQADRKAAGLLKETAHPSSPLAHSKGQMRPKKSNRHDKSTSRGCSPSRIAKSGIVGRSGAPGGCGMRFLCASSWSCPV